MAAAALLHFCAPQAADAQQPASGSAGILRLVSGVQGRVAVGTSDVESVATPDPEGAAPEALATDQDALTWTSPYDVRPSQSEMVSHDDASVFQQFGLEPHVPNQGLGHPLVGTSWLNRPWHAGWFAGAMAGDEPLPDHIDQHTGFFGGYRFGHDFSHYFGWETRLGGAIVGLADPQGVTEGRTGDVFVFDGDLLWYPWGESVWRPYAMIGLGIANYRFVDDQGRLFDEALLGVPIGIGLKYYSRPWLALRFDLVDNFAIGSAGLETMHSFSCTAGVEVHFGGTRKSYWPWHPDRHLW